MACHTAADLAAPLPLGGSLLRLAFTISRSRFWIYTGGTYVVGFSLGTEGWSPFFQPAYYLYLFYFFFVANLFIYGVNDLFDEPTDRNNPRKETIEHRLEKSERQQTTLLVLFSGVFSVALMLTRDLPGELILGGFLLLAFFYSAPPLRFKEHPVLDFSSNILYIMPGVFGYYLAAGYLPPLVFVLAGFLHVCAMHIFSAIPDIACDREAGITTTPVRIGRRTSLKVCYGFWLVFAVLVVSLAGFHPLSLLVFIYPLLPASLLLRRQMSIDTLYRYLPYVNTVLGGLLFTAVTISKMPAHLPPFF